MYLLFLHTHHLISNLQNFSLAHAVEQLRICIAILFSFQRRPMRDERFVRDTQDWLARLVAILVRVGNWQDHMFLLNHVLRYFSCD